MFGKLAYPNLPIHGATKLPYFCYQVMENTDVEFDVTRVVCASRHWQLRQPSCDHSTGNVCSFNSYPRTSYCLVFHHTKHSEWSNLVSRLLLPWPAMLPDGVLYQPSPSSPVLGISCLQTTTVHIMPHVVHPPRSWSSFCPGISHSHHLLSIWPLIVLSLKLTTLLCEPGNVITCLIYRTCQLLLTCCRMPRENRHFVQYVIVQYLCHWI